MSDSNIPTVEPPPKWIVAVSQEMQSLRDVQTVLNKFLWTSEVGYAYFLHDAEHGNIDLTRPLSETLGHLQSHAWMPNRRGRAKLTDTAAKVVEQVRANTIFVCRAVIVYFISAFEQYLERRLQPHQLGPYGQSYRVGWGPYYESLDDRALNEAIHPLRLATIVRADICRLVRNRIIHTNSPLPAAVSDPTYERWKSDAAHKVLSTGWAGPRAAAEVRRALDDGFAEAQRELAWASPNDGPPELLFAMMTFISIDSVSLEIEEALIPKGQLPDGRIFRAPSMLRRSDLIVASSVEWFKRLGRPHRGEVGGTAAGPAAQQKEGPF